MKFKFLKEFKEFAVKGNMIDIAVGVIIGTSFNKVIDVLVKEIFLPPLSLLTDGINWENKKYVLREAIVTDGITKPEEIAIGYGKMIEASFDFMIIAFSVFLVVKFMNSLKRKARNPIDESETTPEDIQLMYDMKELLKEQNNLLKQNS